MRQYPKTTEERIRRSIDLIRNLCTGPSSPVEVSAWHVGGEPVSFETARQAQYVPFNIGDAWGPRWDTTWFRVRAHIPSQWNRADVNVLLQLSDGGIEGFTAEGLVYHNGRIIRAVNVFRNDIPLNQIADPDGSVELFVEAAANVAEINGNALGKGEEPLFQLRQAELAVLRPAVYQYYYDFVVMAELMHELPHNSKRRADLRIALNSSLNVFDKGDPEGTVDEARALLTPVINRRNGDTVHHLGAIGHAHIDTAWLWPLRESIRKSARTFSTAIDYMDQYPEYIFGCSQAQQYAWVKTHYPEVYAGIKERIKSGQWEPIGSMWVEMDCNLSSGESLVRQILKGKQFFRNEFDYETGDAWIPDVFGYSAALPQIFKKCGIDFFVTQKISWNQYNRFPYHTFYWEGIDGSQVFTHFPPADTYNAGMDVKSLLHNVDNFKEHGLSSRSLYVYGYGDGGGGPTVEMLERMRRMNDCDGLPRIAPQKVIDFLRQAEKEATNLPRWVGEIYLELHRGTYTSQSRTKRNNRKCELLLLETEFYDAVAGRLCPDLRENAAMPERSVYDVTGIGEDDNHLHVRALDRAWKLVLLNQFHDILPGSSINWVYEDADRDYKAVRALCDSVLVTSISAVDALVNTSTFEKPIRFANNLGFARSEVVELPGGGEYHLATVPACGYAVIDQADSQPVGDVIVQREGDNIVLQNSKLRVTIDSAGLLDEVFDLEVGRQVLESGKKGNRLQLHPDEPNDWDAWDIDIFYSEQLEELNSVDEIAIVVDDPLQARVRVARSFGSSQVTQDIVLSAGSTRIDFVTDVEWQEERKLLKVAFPVEVRSQRATYEIQYGHIERPTHANTTWDMARFEVCAHKWADLSEPDYGVALLNDCKYGYDILDNVMRLSLLRAPSAPDPVADRGRHLFTYSLFPHQGDFRAGGVVEQAYCLNVPLKVDALPVGDGDQPPVHSWFSVDRSGVLIESVKKAEDGDGIIVRMYEAYGTRGSCTLKTTIPFSSASETNLLEEELRPLRLENGEVNLLFKPFEIVTLHLR